MLRRLSVFGVLLAVIVVAAATWFVRWQWDTSHDQVRAFLSRLNATTTQDDVRRIVSEYNLLAITERQQEPWSVIGTVWFSANDWVAWLDFKNGKLARVRVRTYDSMGDRPRDGPPDRTFEPL